MSEQKPSAPAITYACEVIPAKLKAGDIATVQGTGHNLRPDVTATYTWVTDGGKIFGSSNVANLDTTGVQPGTYQVKGHVAQGDTPGLMADCCAFFEIIATPPASPAESLTAEDSRTDEQVDPVEALYAGLEKRDSELLASWARGEGLAAEHTEVQSVAFHVLSRLEDADARRRIEATKPAPKQTLWERIEEVAEVTKDVPTWHKGSRNEREPAAPDAKDARPDGEWVPAQWCREWREVLELTCTLMGLSIGSAQECKQAIVQVLQELPDAKDARIAEPEYTTADLPVAIPTIQDRDTAYRLVGACPSHNIAYLIAAKLVVRERQLRAALATKGGS